MFLSIIVYEIFGTEVDNVIELSASHGTYILSSGGTPYSFIPAITDGNLQKYREIIYRGFPIANAHASI
jgi:hypothetical protein